MCVSIVFFGVRRVRFGVNMVNRGASKVFTLLTSSFVFPQIREI